MATSETLITLTDAQKAWAEDLQYWLTLPLSEKIEAIIAAIRQGESNKSKVYLALKGNTRYPFTHEGLESPSPPDVCIEAGRVKLPNGRLVDWCIWKSEHSVEIITW